VPSVGEPEVDDEPELRSTTRPDELDRLESLREERDPTELADARDDEEEDPYDEEPRLDELEDREPELDARELDDEELDRELEP